MNGSNLVIGFGNPCLGDDGIGIYLLRDIRKILPVNGYHFLECNEYGLYLIDKLVGYKEVILIDAFSNPHLPAGEIFTKTVHEFNQSFKGASPHYIGITDVIRLGMWYGLDMPGKLALFGINIQNPYEFRDSLSPAMEKCYDSVLSELLNYLHQSHH